MFASTSEIFLDMGNPIVMPKGRTNNEAVKLESFVEMYNLLHPGEEVPTRHLTPRNIKEYITYK